MSGITWGYGEVVSIDNAFNQKTNSAEKTKQGGAPNEAKSTVRGEIEVMLQGNMVGAGNKTSGKKITCYPADGNIIKTPLVGEHVICFQGPGPEAGSSPPDTKTGDKKTGNQFDVDWYYLPPVYLGGNVHLNANPQAAEGGVKSTTNTVQDGEKKSKTEAYENVESGNPEVTNKAPADTGARNTDQNMDKLPPNLDYLSTSMIKKFQKLEEAVLVYKNKMELDNSLTEEGLKEREQKIEDYKQEILDTGYTGEFKESEEKFGYDTNTGYLELSTLDAANYDFKAQYDAGDAQVHWEKIKEMPQNQRGMGDKQFYTLDELNNFTPNPNAPGGGGKGGSNPNTSSPKGGKNRGENQDFVEQEDLNNLQPFEGDMLIQGRFGQSIRLGSTINPKDPARYVKQPSYSAGAAGQPAPINILRAGQSTDQTNQNNDYIIEDINGDKASIYMCSGQQIPITLASPEFKALEECVGGSNGCAQSRYDSNGNVIPSFNCSGGSSGHIDASGQLMNVPVDISDLEELEGDYEYFNTDRSLPNYAKVIGTDKIVLIQGNPVRKTMAPYVLALFQAADRDGIKLKLNSSFRGLWQINHPKTGKKLASGQVNCRYSCAINKSWSTKANMEDRKSPLWTARSSKFSPYVAIPGTSRHQSGTAIDLDYKRYKMVNGKSIKTKTTDKDGVYAWLVANAYKYGFVRTVTTEEWHFEYNLDYAKKGPFGKLSPGSSNRWHGQDKYFQDGTNAWLKKPDPEPERSLGQAYLEVASFGLLGDDDGIIG